MNKEYQLTSAHKAFLKTIAQMPKKAEKLRKKRNKAFKAFSNDVVRD